MSLKSKRTNFNQEKTTFPLYPWKRRTGSEFIYSGLYFQFSSLQGKLYSALDYIHDAEHFFLKLFMLY